MLSTNNLADVISTTGKSGFRERQQHNTLGKPRSYSAVRLGSRPANKSQIANGARPDFERIGNHFGYGEGAYPTANNYSTIIPRKGAFGANLHESTH